MFSALSFSVCLVISTLALGAGATASPQWCEEDPVFVVNGALLDVSTVFPAEYISTVKGPVAFELLVPSNAVAAVVALPGDIPMTAKITRSLPADGLLSLGVPVVVKVTVTASRSFETKTKVTGTYLWLSSTAYGKSNVTTFVRYTLIGL
ncbi:MAG TPA: hypothetical protein VGR46_01860 [Candidatus Limnocylindria bacterium]|nr:hypothetical protein [Candidatus Limnocylindria bacterium]